VLRSAIVERRSTCGARAEARTILAEAHIFLHEKLDARLPKLWKPGIQLLFFKKNDPSLKPPLKAMGLNI